MSDFNTAERVEQEFFCQHGHDFTITFAAEADVPALWDCPNCGTLAGHIPDGEVAQASAQSTKTPFEHLMSRRTVEQMEVALGEALDKLRASRVNA